LLKRKAASARGALMLAFEPFGGDQENPSRWLAHELSDHRLPDGSPLRTFVLPVDCMALPGILRAVLAECNPLAVFGVGYAAGRPCLHAERFAVNLLDFAIPDAAGNQPQGEPIVADGADGYLSTIRPEAMVAASRGAGVPSAVSCSSGTYLCNQLMYLLLHAANSGTASFARTGFVHVPSLPTMEKAMLGRIPSMTGELMLAGVTAMLNECAAEPEQARAGQ
jgi:pyroglutamyl-peptidase